jgi:hypothetical protein
MEFNDFTVIGQGSDKPVVVPELKSLAKQRFRGF